MIDFSFFVDVTFRIINLAVLIFILRYLFKNYLLEAIKKKMEGRRQFMRSLEEHLIAVEHQRTLLAAIIDQESGLGLQVQKKITSWAQAAAADLHARQSHKEQIMRVIAAHAQEREEALMRLQAKRQVIPQALDATSLALSKEFSDPKVAASVVAHIMSVLKVKK